MVCNILIAFDIPMKLRGPFEKFVDWQQCSAEA
jgi:hypothetical protein